MACLLQLFLTDRVFTSQFWRELFTLAGVQLQMSSSYHPQSDGQTERANQTMKTFLRCFVNACPSKWLQWLSLAEFWYNTSSHSAIGCFPFEALYVYPARHFGIIALDSVQSVELSAWMQGRAVMTDLIKQHLFRAKERMKRQADKNRSERVFAVGDMVLLKLQPYVQTSLAPRANQKLAFKYFGPYKAVARIGQVAYKLLLPESSTIQPVFHVSQLKKFHAASPEVHHALPDEVDNPRIPQKVLQKRMSHQRIRSRHQVLVQWSGWPVHMATWEDEEHLRQRFPAAPVWGQAALQEGGDVNSPASDFEADSPELPSLGARNRRPNPRVYGPDWA